MFWCESCFVSYGSLVRMITRHETAKQYQAIARIDFPRIWGGLVRLHRVFLERSLITR